MKSPEFKKMMGEREKDSDGFTYSYGRFKFNRSAKPTKTRDRCIRNDKRSVKAAELKQIEKDNEYIQS